MCEKRLAGKEETRPGVTQGTSKLQGSARRDEESFPKLWRQAGNTASKIENASGCGLGMSAAQVSAGQCGAVNRSGHWWWACRLLSWLCHLSAV